MTPLEEMPHRKNAEKLMWEVRRQLNREERAKNGFEEDNTETLKRI